MALVPPNGGWKHSLGNSDDDLGDGDAYDDNGADADDDGGGDDGCSTPERSTHRAMECACIGSLDSHHHFVRQDHSSLWTD